MKLCIVVLIAFFSIANAADDDSKYKDSLIRSILAKAQINTYGNICNNMTCFNCSQTLCDNCTGVTCDLCLNTSCSNFTSLNCTNCIDGNCTGCINNMPPVPVSCVGCYLNECNCGIFKCPRAVPVLKKQFYEKGLLGGTDTSLPLVDNSFIYQILKMCPCTYLRISDNCSVLPTSGVYIGAEIDLMKASRRYRKYNDSNSTYAGNLTLYSIATDELGVGPGFVPSVTCTTGNVTPGLNDCLYDFDPDSIKTINDKFMNDVAQGLQKLYDDCRINVTVPANTTKLNFIDLPRGIRTSLFLTHYVNLDPNLYAASWRYYVQQNWEGVDFYIRSKELATTDPSYNLGLKRQRFLIENAHNPPCPTQMKNLTVLLLIDLNPSQKAYDIVDGFVQGLQNAPFLASDDFNIQLGMVYQDGSDTVQNIPFTPVNKLTNSSYDLTLIGHYDSVTPSFIKAQNMLAQKTDSTLNMLIYIGTDIPDPSSAYKVILELRNNNTVMYAVSGNSSFTTNIVMAAQTNGFVYVYNEVSNVLEAIDNWTKYFCTLPKYVAKRYSYNANVIPAFNTSVDYFSFVSLSTTPAALNISVQISAPDITQVKVYYSTRFQNPGPYLRDGMAVLIDGKLLISFSYYDIQNDTTSINYYYSIQSAVSQLISINITQGYSPLIKDCETACLDCDLMGQNCKKCAPYYENIRGSCRKAYRVADVAFTNNRNPPTGLIYGVIFGIIGVACALACIVSNSNILLGAKK